MKNVDFEPKSMSYFMGDDIPWVAQNEKARRKILRLEEHIYIALIQWDAGYRRVDLDEHGGEETVYVLEGDFHDGGPVCGPGAVVRGDAGGHHQPGTENGVTFLVVRTLVPGERARMGPMDWQRPQQV